MKSALLRNVTTMYTHTHTFQGSFPTTETRVAGDLSLLAQQHHFSSVCEFSACEHHDATKGLCSEHASDIITGTPVPASIHQLLSAQPSDISFKAWQHFFASMPSHNGGFRFEAEVWTRIALPKFFNFRLVLPRVLLLYGLQCPLLTPLQLHS